MQMQIQNNNHTKNEEKNFNDFIQTILKEINLMDEVWVIDRIENNIAICENRANRRKIEINVSELPKEIKEGTVLKYRKGGYVIDTDLQKSLEKNIKEKMQNIWDN